VRKIGILPVLSVVVVILIFGIAGCSSSTGSTETPVDVTSTTSVATNVTASNDDSAVRVYADAETETTLQGLSENNLEKYTQYGNSAFKAAVTQDVFDKTVAQINSQLGVYVSKEFQSTEIQQGYTVVYYRAKYANADVNVKMVFDANHQVAGQFFVQ
jgi:biopolymer transport protein ExbD